MRIFAYLIILLLISINVYSTPSGSYLGKLLENGCFPREIDTHEKFIDYLSKLTTRYTRDEIELIITKSELPKTKISSISKMEQTTHTKRSRQKRIYSDKVCRVEVSSTELKTEPDSMIFFDDASTEPKCQKKDSSPDESCLDWAKEIYDRLSEEQKLDPDNFTNFNINISGHTDQIETSKLFVMVHSQCKKISDQGILNELNICEKAKEILSSECLNSKEGKSCKPQNLNKFRLLYLKKLSETRAKKMKERLESLAVDIGIEILSKDQITERSTNAKEYIKTKLKTTTIIGELYSAKSFGEIKDPSIATFSRELIKCYETFKKKKIKEEEDIDFRMLQIARFMFHEKSCSKTSNFHKSIYSITTRDPRTFERFISSYETQEQQKKELTKSITISPITISAMSDQETRIDESKRTETSFTRDPIQIKSQETARFIEDQSKDINCELYTVQSSYKADDAPRLALQQKIQSSNHNQNNFSFSGKHPLSALSLLNKPKAKILSICSQFETLNPKQKENLVNFAIEDLYASTFSNSNFENCESGTTDFFQNTSTTAFEFGIAPHIDQLENIQCTTKKSPIDQSLLSIGPNFNLFKPRTYSNLLVYKKDFECKCGKKSCDLSKALQQLASYNKFTFIARIAALRDSAERERATWVEDQGDVVTLSGDIKDLESIQKRILGCTQDRAIAIKRIQQEAVSSSEIIKGGNSSIATRTESTNEAASM